MVKPAQHRFRNYLANWKRRGEIIKILGLALLDTLVRSSLIIVKHIFLDYSMQMAVVQDQHMI